MKKLLFLFTMAMLVSFGGSMTAFAQSDLPRTGDQAAELVPLFIILILVAIGAMIACIFLFRKKK